MLPTCLRSAPWSQSVDELGRDESDEEPHGSGVDGVPQGFLRAGDVRRAEDDEGAGGAGVEELGERDAVCVGIVPGAEDAHGAYGGGEGEKEKQPVGTVRRGCAQVIDDGDMPGASKNPSSTAVPRTGAHAEALLPGLMFFNYCVNFPAN
jgi:hypothetical protein